MFHLTKNEECTVVLILKILILMIIIIKYLSQDPDQGELLVQMLNFLSDPLFSITFTLQPYEYVLYHVKVSWIFSYPLGICPI